jgi:hypothetical protein
MIVLFPILGKKFHAHIMIEVTKLLFGAKQLYRMARFRDLLHAKLLKRAFVARII